MVVGEVDEELSIDRIKTDFLFQLHTQYFKHYLDKLSTDLKHYDEMRPLVTHFVVSSLDIMNALDESMSAEKKKQICDDIYSMQVVPENDLNSEDEDIDQIKRYGFQGSFPLIVNNKNVAKYTAGHLTMTYFCLCTLLILGDDLNRVNRVAILKALKYLQLDDGSFQSSVVSGERDIRFVYSAAAICYILNDWTYINIDNMVNFVISCIGYDGAIAQFPYLESHGASSFCGIATLSLVGRLQNTLTSEQRAQVQRWLLFRQETTFQGRPNKAPDTCYSLWIGASLTLLDSFQYADWIEIKKYLLRSQCFSKGGFSKWPSTESDFVHSYLALCGLSLMNDELLKEIHPALIISQHAHSRLIELHKKHLF